jgi:hypothetical protein
MSLQQQIAVPIFLEDPGVAVIELETEAVRKVGFTKQPKIPRSIEQNEENPLEIVIASDLSLIDLGFGLVSHKYFAIQELTDTPNTPRNPSAPRCA